MDKNLAFMISVSVLANAALIYGGLRLWFEHRERRAIQPDRLARLEEQLRHTQHAIDTIAVEVERISEGQRYTTKLLTDRAGLPAASRQPERVITPH